MRRSSRITRGAWPVADQTASSRDWTTIGLGALTAAIGLFCFAIGLGLVPVATARHGGDNAPGWIGFLIGLVFLAGGLAVILRGLARADDSSGELPATAPRWVAIIYWLLGLLIAAGLAATGTWVAIGSGTRHFVMWGPIGGPVGETVGRTAFGIGAIISWLIVAAMRAPPRKRFSARINAAAAP
jgi:hypothetical protein